MCFSKSISDGSDASRSFLGFGADVAFNSAPTRFQSTLLITLSALRRDLRLNTATFPQAIETTAYG
ncbi:Uncharacterised protein [Mycobacterium tuberculosis]|nr:Uncharacterised protein [Mycobacterium tuberculosis]